MTIRSYMRPEKIRDEARSQRAYDTQRWTKTKVMYHWTLFKYSLELSHHTYRNFVSDKRRGRASPWIWYTEPYSIESLNVSLWSHFAISQRSYVIDFLWIIMLGLVFCLMTLRYCLRINVNSWVLSRGSRQHEHVIQKERSEFSLFFSFVSLLVFHC